jgi:hypothetical protein
MHPGCKNSQSVQEIKKAMLFNSLQMNFDCNLKKESSPEVTYYFLLQIACFELLVAS